MSGVAGLHIVLFFTRGLSLADWHRIGVLERELALYRRLIDAGARVSLVTWGGAADAALAQQIAPIEVCCNERELLPAVYAVALPWLHRDTLRECDVIKTNQTDGGPTALRAARWWRKPLIARCGFMWSFNLAQRRGEHDRRTRCARRVEVRLFSRARRVQVTTEAMARDVAQRIPAASPRIRVVPNYVQTDVFHPASDGRTPQVDLVYVGRFTWDKNVAALLEAVADLPVSLAMIGDGPLRAQWEPKMREARARVEWRGSIPHAQLPQHLCGAKAFILPSRYEGHPKALIEAMACGLPVIASDRPGIRELVSHGVTGYLCGAEPGEIRTAVEVVLGDAALRAGMGAAARAFAAERFSLDRVFEMEARVIEEAVADG